MICPKDGAMFKGSENTSVYNIFVENQQSKQECSKKIFNFFKKKPEVVFLGRKEKNYDPGVNLAMQLYAENTISVGNSQPEVRRSMSAKEGHRLLPKHKIA